MELTWLSPWGLLGLLSIPLIVLLHFFQRRTRTVLVSTLFLLPQIKSETSRGRSFTFFHSSVVFWLQMLTAILLSLLLAQPRLLHKQETQKVILVLDASASMSAFNLATIEEIKKEIEQSARHSTWHVLTTSRKQETLYQGSNFLELMRSLRAYSFASSRTDPEPALQLARQLAGDAGRIIFITDHKPQTLPESVEWLSIGSPEENTGFTGMTLLRQGEDGLAWKALLRNYSESTKTLSWHIEAANGTRSDAFSVTLSPDSAHSLSGVFPDGVNALVLVKEEDAFPLDDRLPIVRPQEKLLLAVFDTALDPQGLSWLQRLIRACRISHNERAMGDILFETATEPTSISGVPPRIVFITPDETSTQVSAAPKLLPSHPLTDDLNFNALIAPKSPAIGLSDADTPLLWQDDVPLIFLRSREGVQDLYFNVDTTASNLTRLPSFVVLVDRYLDTLRARKIAYERTNLELGVVRQVAVPKGKLDLRIGGEPVQTITAHGSVTAIQAPHKPCIFTLHDAKNLELLQAAAAFGDAREADLRQAEAGSSFFPSEDFLYEATIRNDFLDTVLLFLALGCLLSSWWFIGKGRQ